MNVGMPKKACQSGEPLISRLIGHVDFVAKGESQQ
jgi:hypothetical protein